MDSTKRSLPIDRIPRRDSGSTIASEKYSPMPHGRWTLDIHGNCPRCHHHHTAVTVQVTVSSNSAQASHVYCEKCKQKWLAFGGRNVTQISLLSTKTTEPDPVEKDFRYSLVHMVKSATAPATAIATAIAAPSAPLPDIPESSRTPSRDRSLRAQNLDIPQTVPGPSSITVMAQSNPSGSLLVAPSIHSHKNRSFGRRRIQIQSALIGWKQKLKDKFPILRQIRSKYSKNELLRPRTASKGKEKQRQDQKPSEPTMTPGEQLAPVNPRTDETTKVSPTEADQVNSHAHYSSADDAINSLKKFDKEIIRQMSREERVKWVRDQITAFKAQRFQELSTKADNEPGIPPMINNSTQIYHAELQPFPFVASRPQRRHSVELDIVGLGTQFSLSDLYNPSTPTLHNRPLSISDTCVSQMSQADTAVDDTAVSASQRLSYLSQHERQRSPSPRPRSSYSQAHLRQQVLQGRVEARTSLDSAGTAAAVRSMSTAGRRMNRVSVQSMGSLLQANPDPSGSQTQLPPPLPGAVGPNRSREVVYSDSTPNLNEYHPPNEDNRRSTD